MADENAARFEQMEQTTQELKEMLLKNQEEHREQMANLMEMVLQLTKGKATTESPIPTEVATGSELFKKSLLVHLVPHQLTCNHPKGCVLYQILLHLLLKQLKRHVQYLHHL